MGKLQYLSDRKFVVLRSGIMFMTCLLLVTTAAVAAVSVSDTNTDDNDAAVAVAAMNNLRRSSARSQKNNIVGSSLKYGAIYDEAMRKLAKKMKKKKTIKTKKQIKNSDYEAFGDTNSSDSTTVSTSYVDHAEYALPWKEFGTSRDEIAMCLQECTYQKQLRQSVKCDNQILPQERTKCTLTTEIAHYNCIDRCRNVNPCTAECPKIKGKCLLICERNQKTTLSLLQCRRACHFNKEVQVNTCFQTCYDTPSPTAAPTTAAPTPSPTISMAPTTEPPTPEPTIIVTIPEGTQWAYQIWDGTMITKYDELGRIWIGKEYPNGAYGPDDAFAGLQGFVTLDETETLNFLRGRRATVLWEPATLIRKTVQVVDESTILAEDGSFFQRVAVTLNAAAGSEEDASIGFTAFVNSTDRD